MFLFRCKTELASTESNLISFIFQHQQTTNFCNKKKIRKRFKTTFTKPHPQHPVHPLNQDPIKVYREFTIKVCPPWSSKLAKVRLNRLLHNRKYSVTKTPRLKSPWFDYMMAITFTSEWIDLKIRSFKLFFVYFYNLLINWSL